MAPIAGWKGQIYLGAGPSLTLTDETLTDAGAHTVYNDSNGAHQYWDESFPFVVQTSPDGVTWTPVTTGFVINYPIGQVVFSPANPVGTQVRVHSGKYMAAVFLGFCKEWGGNLAGTALEDTAMTNPPSQWKTFIAGVNGGNAKLLHWWIDNTMFGHLTAGDTLILALYTGVNANQRFQGYVILKTEDIKAMANAVTTDDLDFDFNGQVFYIPS